MAAPSSISYRIAHSTTYRYSVPVSVCHNVIMLTPCNTSEQICHSHRLTIRPTPVVTDHRTDLFGNHLHRFSLEENHSQLTITATSHVTVHARELQDTAAELTCGQLQLRLTNREDSNWLEVIPFVFNSPRIRRSDVFAEYGRVSVADDRSVIDAARDLTARVFTDFKYDKNATNVHTPTETAFAGRHGVCQDFSHVAVACLRSCGIPTRYVSGYLRTVPAPGKPRLVGADQSHAWISVYCGDQQGWVDFDPTNNCLCSTDHIVVAVGRDYGDVVPVKGVFLGGGDPALTVSVDVAPVD